MKLTRSPPSHRVSSEESGQEEVRLKYSDGRAAATENRLEPALVISLTDSGAHLRPYDPAWETSRYRQAGHLTHLMLDRNVRDDCFWSIGRIDGSPPGRKIAHGLTSKNARTIGDRPIPLVAPRPGGRFVRALPSDPVWASRWQSNLSLLEPRRYLSTLALSDFDLVARREVPAVSRAVQELDALLGDFWAPAPDHERALSPMAALILVGHRLKKHPFPAGQQPSHLRARDAMGDLMDEASKCGPTDRTAMIRKYGPVGGELFDALMTAMPEPRGLQQTLYRGRFPIEPAFDNLPPTREEMQKLKLEAPDRIAEAVRLADIPAHLPAIDAAADLVPDGCFRDVDAVCVQHLLGTEVTLLDAMAKKGLSPERTELIGIPYSTSYVAQEALRERGYRVDTPAVLNPTEVDEAVETMVERALQRALDRNGSRPILVLDDGGRASRVIARCFADRADRFRIVEQTTHGANVVRGLERAVSPTINVAQAPLKAYESAKIGGEVAENLETLTERVGLGRLRGRAVTVIGYGTIGRGVAAALSGLGAEVTVWDRDPRKRREARRAGLAAPADRAQALADKFAIVGCTGDRSIGVEDLRFLSHETVLASASSSACEIDVSVSSDPEVEVVPLLTEGPGDDRFVTRVWRFADKDLVLMRNGFPINFNGTLETGTPESIQQTRALMLLGAAQALETERPGLQPLSTAQQARLVESCPDVVADAAFRAACRATPARPTRDLDL